MSGLLPTLPFGHLQAPVEKTLRRFEFVQAQVHSALNRYEPRSEPFLYRAATVALPSLKIVASAHTPLHVDVGPNSDFTILVPFAGWSTATIGKQTFRSQANTTALYLPGVARSGDSGRRSLLSISFDRARIEQTSAAMDAGLPGGNDLMLQEPRLLPLHRGGMDFGGLFRHVCGLLDAAALNPRDLERLGIEDLVYRAIVLLLSSDLRLGMGVAPIAPPTRAAINRACEFIEQNLDKRISLTDLERESGLQARTIQLGFQRHFACTPREWIVNRRLDRARQLLRDPHGPGRISDIASRCGFTRLASFAEAYQRRFGEKPSQSRRRS